MEAVIFKIRKIIIILTSYFYIFNSYSCEDNELITTDEEVSCENFDVEKPSQFHSIINESCFDILNNIETNISNINNIKLILCENIQKNLNNGEKLLNTFSSMWQASIQFSENKDTFTQILPDGTYIFDWALSDWISDDINFHDLKSKFIFAFGEMPSILEPKGSFNFVTFKNSEQKIWGVWDIRFIDTEGYIWYAKEHDFQSDFKVKYFVEDKLHMEDLKNVYAVFKGLGTDLIFLKKIENEGVEKFIYEIFEYNIEARKYIDISATGNVSDLFLQIPLEDISQIDYIQKIPGDMLAIFKKSPISSDYLGYYLISVNDIKNENALVTYVKAGFTN